jgi:uncharacterized membrane protein YkgB
MNYPTKTKSKTSFIISSILQIANPKVMHRYGFILLRYSLAIIFFWFGILKPFGLSPANELIANTVYWFPSEWFIPILGWWEVTIGILMIFRPTVKYALMLLFLQIPGTFLPLVLLPEITFTEFPYGLTLEGQYIIKNLTLIAAAIAVGGTIDREHRSDEIL